MATKGRLEGVLLIPTGGYDVSINDSGGGGAATATLAAGEYFLSSAATTGSSLIAAFEAALNVAATTDTITVTLSAGESGTGKVTITSTGSTTLTWTDVDLRNLLGFTTDLAAGTSWTGANQARGMWLPDCAYKSYNGGGGFRGWRETDWHQLEDAAGNVCAWKGQGLQANWLSWNAVSRSRTWIGHETTTNASWERFALDCLWGDSPWGSAGRARFYSDADNNASFCSYNIPDFTSIDPEQVMDGWAAGPWRINLPRMLVDPNYAAYGGGV